jgi:hypothetical protein
MRQRHSRPIGGQQEKRATSGRMEASGPAAFRPWRTAEPIDRPYAVAGTSASALRRVRRDRAFAFGAVVWAFVLARRVPVVFPGFLPRFGRRVPLSRSPRWVAQRSFRKFRVPTLIVAV